MFLTEVLGAQNTVSHESFAGVYFCGLVIFCILWGLSFVIRTGQIGSQKSEPAKISCHTVRLNICLLTALFVCWLAFHLALKDTVIAIVY